MRKTKVYLDNCCFNRPYDDLTNINVKLEAEAKMFIQHQILLGNLELVWSDLMDYENSANPFPDRKEAISKWKDVSVANVHAANVHVSTEIFELAHEISLKGVKKKDALHIASAIEAECQYFITTGKKTIEQIV